MKRGIIITNSIEIDPKNNSIRFTPVFDQKSIRYGVLYLDEICIPQNRIFTTILPEDMMQLKKEKILSERFNDSSTNGVVDMASAAADSYFQTFSELNKNKNETWCLNKEFKLVNDLLPFIDSNGETLTFLNALPIPAEDFPLGDLYEFREKRNDERIELMNSIDRLRLKVLNSDNKATALQEGLLDVESNLITITRLMKETKKGFYLSNLSLDYSSQEMINAFKGTYQESTASGLDTLSSLLLSMGASLASGFDLKCGFRYKKANVNSPYFYAAEVSHKFNT